MDRVLIYTTLFFIIISITLFNIVPVNSIDWLDMVYGLYLLPIVSIPAIMYTYLCGVYIYSVVELGLNGKDRYHNNMLLFIKYFLKKAGSLLEYLVYVIIYYIVGFVLSLYAISNPGSYIVIAWVMLVVALFLEFIILPRIIVLKIIDGKARLSKIIVMYTIPWIILLFTVSTTINYLIYSIYGELALYPYIHPWSKIYIEMLKEGVKATWIPTYGEWLGVIALALYSRWVVSTYQLKPG